MNDKEKEIRKGDIAYLVLFTILVFSITGFLLGSWITKISMIKAIEDFEFTICELQEESLEFCAGLINNITYSEEVCADKIINYYTEYGDDIKRLNNRITQAREEAQKYD